MKRTFAICGLGALMMGAAGCEAPVQDSEFRGVWSVRYNDSCFRPVNVDLGAAEWSAADRTKDGTVKPWWLIAEENSPIFRQYFDFCRGLPGRIRFSPEGVLVFVKFRGVLSAPGDYGPGRKYPRMVYPRQLLEFSLPPGADGETPDFPAFQPGIRRFFSTSPA